MSAVEIKQDSSGTFIDVIGDAIVNVTGADHAQVNVASKRGSSSSLRYDVDYGFVVDREQGDETLAERISILGEYIRKDFKHIPSPANGDVIAGAKILLQRYRAMLDLSETVSDVPHITVDGISRPLTEGQCDEYKQNGTIGARAVRSANQQYSRQISDLADFIVDNFKYEPSRSEGAVETAIRLLGEFAEAKKCARSVIEAIQGHPYNQTEKPLARRSYAEPEEPLNTFHLDGYEGVLRMTLDDGAIWDQYIWRDSTTTLGQHVVLAEQEAQLKGRRIVELSLRPPMTFTQGDEPKDARAGDLWRNVAEERRSNLDRFIGFKMEDCADSNIGPVSAYTVDDDDTDETEDDIRVESLGDLGYILDALGGLMSPLVDAAIALAAQALQAYTEAQERERDT